MKQKDFWGMMYTFSPFINNNHMKYYFTTLPLAFSPSNQRVFTHFQQRLPGVSGIHFFAFCIILYSPPISRALYAQLEVNFLINH
jgi:hypothetical protein